jgi:hypothetical protein
MNCKIPTHRYYKAGLAQVVLNKNCAMKNSLKIAGLFLIGVGLFSFSLIDLKPITVDSIRSTFLSTIFDTYTQEGDDTTVFFTRKSDYSDEMEKAYATRKCGSSPTFIAYSFYAGLDTAYTDYGADVTNRYKTLFGTDIIKAKVKIAAKDWEGKPMYWNHFNGLAIKAAFDKLYQKPSGSYQGIGLQKIYNAAMKDYVRDMTNVIIKVMANKPAFEATAKQYLTKATTDPEFDGLSFGGEATEKLIGKFTQPCLEEYYGERVVGTMLRRQCDGSLPVLLTCLKTLLKDYDPEFYNKVALKF